MKFFRQKICSLGNFYFHSINEDMKGSHRIVCYPAGHLFFIVVPVTDDNLPFIDKLFNEEQLPQQHCKVTGFYETDLVAQYKNGTTRHIKIHLLELTAAMAFVYDTVKYLVDNNMVLNEKMYRGLIYEAGSRCNTVMSSFYGNENDSWKHYYITLKRLV